MSSMIANRFFITAICMICVSAFADETSTLSRYLERLGADELRLVHEERALRAAPPGERRTLIAKRLADLYVARLLGIHGNDESFERLSRRINDLQAAFPEIATPSLRVLLLQAEYRRGEEAALRALDDPADLASRVSARESLTNTAAELHRRIEELTAAVEAMSARIEAMDASKSSEEVSLDRELRALQAALARARYFHGWSRLFLAWSADDPTAIASPEMTGEASFAALLEVALELAPDREESEAYELDSVWRARAWLGFAISPILRGELDLASARFDLLAASSAPKEVRSDAVSWRIAALLNTGRVRETAELLEDSFSRKVAIDPTAAVRCGSLLLRYGWLAIEFQEQERKLIHYGVRLLVRAGRFDSLLALAEKYDAQPRDDDDFYLQWMHARRAFTQVEREAHRDPTRYQECAFAFRKALESSSAAEDPSSAAKCRYESGWAEYKAGRFGEAERAFDHAARDFRVLGDSTGAAAYWMAFIARRESDRGGEKTSGSPESCEYLRMLRRDFPDSEQAQQAELLLLKSRTDADTPEELLVRLTAVPPSAANYAAAQWEIVSARFGLWKKSQEKGGGRSEVSILAVLRSDIDRYLAAVPESEGANRVKAALLGIEAESSAAAPDFERIASLLAATRTAFERLAIEHPLAIEYRYRTMQRELHAGGDQGAAKSAQWLMEHAAGSAFELPASIVFARDLDRRLKSAAESDVDSLRKDAIEAYRKLCRLFGDDIAALKTKKNAAVANRRLAELELQAGEFTAAAQRFERITEVDPRDRGAIHGSAAAWHSARSFERSLPLWEKLVASAAAGTPEFFEAKYHQLECLLRIDREAAEQVHKRFRTLYPEVKDEQWRERFSVLERGEFGK